MRGDVERRSAFFLPLNCLAMAVTISSRSMPSSSRHDADVDHVRQQLAQLRVVGAGSAASFANGTREGDVVADGLAASAARRRCRCAPGCSASTSSRAVCAFMQTRMSTSFLRAIQPSLFARMVNQVGQPGDIRREHVLAADRHAHLEDGAHQDVVRGLEPEPLTVATWMVKSLTTGSLPAPTSSARSSPSGSRTQRSPCLP